MRYYFSIQAPYVYLNYMADKNPITLEHTVFSDIILSYMKYRTIKWYYDVIDNDSYDKLTMGLSMYLTDNSVREYIYYLDTIFWQTINRNIPDNISGNQSLSLETTPSTELTLILSIDGSSVNAMTEYQRVLDKVYHFVKDKLYEGAHVDPLLREIYDAHIAAHIQGDDTYVDETDGEYD